MPTSIEAPVTSLAGSGSHRKRWRLDIPVPRLCKVLTEIERRGSASGRPPLARLALVRCRSAIYAGGMRYPDGGGLSPTARERRETVRLQAARLFAEDVAPVQVAARLRVSTKSAYQWRRR